MFLLKLAEKDAQKIGQMYLVHFQASQMYSFLLGRVVLYVSFVIFFPSSRYLILTYFSSLCYKTLTKVVYEIMVTNLPPIVGFTANDCMVFRLKLLII